MKSYQAFAVFTLTFFLSSVAAKALGKEEASNFQPLTEKTPFQAWDCSVSSKITSFDMADVGQCENPDLGRQEEQVTIQVLKAVEEFDLKVNTTISSSSL